MHSHFTLDDPPRGLPALRLFVRVQGIELSLYRAYVVSLPARLGDTASKGSVERCDDLLEAIDCVALH